MKSWLKKIISKFVELTIRAVNKDTIIKLSQKVNAINDNFTFDKYRKMYKIEDTFFFNGSIINFYGEGQIICGKNSYIGNLSTIQASKGYKVFIGDNVSISHNVRIYTESTIADQDFSQQKKIKKGNVIIEDYVWIGVNVFINPGIRIGKNSVIGANSVVTKDILPNTIVGGSPARLIKEKTTN